MTLTDPAVREAARSLCDRLAAGGHPVPAEVLAMAGEPPALQLSSSWPAPFGRCPDCADAEAAEACGACGGDRCRRLTAPAIALALGSAEDGPRDWLRGQIAEAVEAWGDLTGQGFERLADLAPGATPDTVEVTEEHWPDERHAIRTHEIPVAWLLLADEARQAQVAAALDLRRRARVEAAAALASLDARILEEVRASLAAPPSGVG